MGDSSDNLAGVPGVGEKTAINLIGTYQNLENIYQHLDDFTPGLKAKLISGKASAFFTREMATLDSNCPLTTLNLENFALDLSNLKSFLERYEMKSILKRLGLLESENQILETLNIDHHPLKAMKIKMINH